MPLKNNNKVWLRRVGKIYNLIKIHPRKTLHSNFIFETKKEHIHCKHLEIIREMIPEVGPFVGAAYKSDNLTEISISHNVLLKMIIKVWLRRVSFNVGAV